MRDELGGDPAAAPENITDAFFVVDDAWRFTHLNREAERLLGGGREDLLGRSVWEELPEAVGSTFGERCRRAAAERTTAEFEEHCPPLGTTFGVKAYPCGGGLAVHLRDVTGREEAEGRVREAERSYRTLVERLPAVVYRQGLGTGEDLNDMSYVSPYVEAMLGYPARRFTTDPDFWVGLVHPEDRGRVLAEDARCAETHEPFAQEYRLLARDGRAVWVRDEAAVVRDGEGRPLFWQGVMLDVTGRRRAEEALEESEERFRYMVQNSSDLITLVGADGAVRYSSPALERILGYGPQERVGRNIFDLLHPDDADGARALFAEGLESPGVPLKVEVRQRHKDGSWRDVEVTGTNLLGDPRAGAVVLNSRDVTERKRAEDALRESEGRFRQLFENSADALFVVHPETREVVDCNLEACRSLGYPREELLALRLEDFASEVPSGEEKERRGPDAPWRRALAGEPGTIVGFHENVHRRRDGTTFPVEVGVGPMDYAGRRMILASCRDVTERKRAEKALRESEERHRAVVEQTAEGIYLLDVETRRVLEANAAFGELLGYAPGELPGMAAHDFVTQSPEELEGNIRRTLEEGRRFVGERRYRRKGGSLVDVEVNVSVIHYGGRDVICAAVRDVTERKRAEEETRRSERELAEAQRIARVGSWSFGVAENEGRWSDEMYRIFGFAPREFVVTYKRFMGLVHPDDRDLLREAVRGALYGDGDRHGLDYRLVRPDGGVRFLHSEYEVVRDGSGRPVRLVGTSQDVTERRALEEELERRALHDALTGLPNRALFLDRLSQALTRGEGRGGEGGGKQVAVLFVDLDNFKYVNDSLGHGVGDRLLVAVAGRLRKVFRPEDTAARLGGDEFAVLLQGVGDRSQAKRVAGRVIKALRSPFALGGGRDVFATPSIGIALGEPGRDSAADLLRRADVAMYRAKRGGKARHELFGPAMEAEVVGRLGLEHDLRRALERGEFAARYQPIVRLGGTGERPGDPGDPGDAGRVVGFEALLRWEHPERGLLAPSEFLPLAEELGLTVPIGRWLLGEACRQTKEWQERHPPAAPLAVGANLSARQLSHPGLLGDVEAACRDAGLAPEQMTLEVTEDAVVGEAGRPVEALRGLRDAGFLLALDDFGTGHSSLSHLRRLPVSLVKIDRSFVARLGKDGCEEDEVLLSGIVGIAHGLGLLVCAEGVETEEQLRRVGALGCGLAQGYYFSEPLEAGEADALLARGPAR